MKQTITYDKEKDSFIVSMEIPKHMSGKYYPYEEDDGEWTETAVCVFIDKDMCSYTLNHTQYLDYKDSLQATQAILHFDNEKQAVKFAKDNRLMIEYSR